MTVELSWTMLLIACWTLSEIGLALKIGRPVVAIGAWHEIAGVRRADDAESAVALAFKLAGIALAEETRND